VNVKLHETVTLLPSGNPYANGYIVGLKGPKFVLKVVEKQQQFREFWFWVGAYHCWKSHYCGIS